MQFLRRAIRFLAPLCVAAAAFCADTAPPMIPCPGAGACALSKKDEKDAKAAFKRGLKLQKSQKLDEAFSEFESASALSPRNVEYLTAREMARQQLVYNHLQAGNASLLTGKQVEALAEFRTALHLDPRNEFAQQRLKDALGEWGPHTEGPARIVEASAPVEVNPRPGKHDFHYRGDARGLLTQVTQAFGVVAVFDDSVVARRVRFDVEQVDFFKAMELAGAVTHTFDSPLSAGQVLIANDTPENHKQFDQLAMRTFYVPGVTAPIQLTELVTVLRTMFEVKFLTQQPATSTLVVRAPADVLDNVTRFLDDLGDSTPEVLIDFNVYEVSHTLMRNMGLQLPNQFTLFNIPAGALLALGGTNIQDLINQLISSGGINQANSQALSGLLAQLQNQQNSIFSQPIATFGGGLTLMGLSLGTLGAQLQLNESNVKTLEHATLRATQGKDANLRIGSRYPILNASFAPIFNTAAISQNIQNNTFQPAFPSFNYEDLGLTVKVKPTVQGDSQVRLDLQTQFRVLGTTSLNGVPVISNREYQGSIGLRDGEPAVIASMVSHNELRSLSGIPGLGSAPLLNHVMVSNSREEDDDELLIMITPHISRAVPDRSAPGPWITTGR